jgi:lipopolysaccharide/colanic/teichoic acid biosynthesis glycosyltransferase
LDTPDSPGQIPSAPSHAPPRRHRGELSKRALDLVLSLSALLILGLPFIVIALVIRIQLGAPVFFRAIRAGRWGQPFVIYKFRTMHNWRDASGQLLPDEERITDLGRLLRRTSLDELPQLFNVIRGEMSLVGPRPLLIEYLDRYTPLQARRLEVRPGITGWAQVNGRNDMSWEAKFQHDHWYVTQVSVPLDLRIMARTLLQVVRRHNVDADGDLSVPIFMGSTEDTTADEVAPICTESPGPAAGIVAENE